MKKTNLVIAVIFGAFALGGCAYQAHPKVNPAVSVYQNYSDKIPGRYALYVGAEEMKAEFKVSGYVCSAHTYPVDAISQFVSSAQQTFENVFENVEFVESPVDRSVLQSSALDGLIVVEVDSFEIDMRAVSGFWTAELDSEAEIVVKAFVDGPEGRVFGTTVEGDDDDKREAGAFCSNGSEAIGNSIESAMKEVLRNLAEKLANSPRLRGLQ